MVAKTIADAAAELDGFAKFLRERESLRFRRSAERFKNWFLNKLSSFALKGRKKINRQWFIWANHGSVQITQATIKEIDFKWLICLLTYVFVSVETFKRFSQIRFLSWKKRSKMNGHTHWTVRTGPVTNIAHLFLSCGLRNREKKQISILERNRSPPKKYLLQAIVRHFKERGQKIVDQFSNCFVY